MYVTIYYWRHQSMANSVAVRIIQSFHLRRQIVLRIPIDLDFKDSSKKDAIHRSWRYERNVPLFMALPFFSRYLAIFLDTLLAGAS